MSCLILAATGAELLVCADAPMTATPPLLNRCAAVDAICGLAGRLGHLRFEGSA
jgi:hypothetical protein